MAIEGYYYLHENGDLIYKRNMPGILEDFANSDLVKHYWPADLTDRGDAWLMLIEATAFGANASRVAELAQKWGCDNEDALKFADHVSGGELKLEQEGNEFHATFNYEGKDYMGVGPDYLHAMADQLRELKSGRTKEQRLAEKA